MDLLYTNKVYQTFKNKVFITKYKKYLKVESKILIYEIKKKLKFLYKNENVFYT
jgi:hypothetical protein